MSYKSKNMCDCCYAESTEGKRELEERVKAGESLKASNAVLRRKLQKASVDDSSQDIVLNCSTTDCLPITLLYDRKTKHLFIHKVIYACKKFK